MTEKTDEVFEGIRQIESAVGQHPNVVNVKIEKAKALALVAEVKKLREEKGMPIENQTPYEVLMTFARQSGAANAALVRLLHSMANQLQALTDVVLEMRDGREAQKEKGAETGQSEAEQARAVPAGAVGESRGEEAGDAARAAVLVGSDQSN